MAQLLILSPAANDDVLPALSLLTHRTRVIPASPEQLVRAPESDLVFLDARTNLAGAKALCKILRTTGLVRAARARRHRGRPHRGHARLGRRRRRPRSTAGPAEVDARIRLALGRAQSVAAVRAHPDLRRRHRRGQLLGEGARPPARPHLQGVRAAALPRGASVARLHPRAAAQRGVGLRLLRRHPHGRRARAAPPREARRPRVSLIGTVRNVGYRFNVHEEDDQGAPTVTAR